MFNINENKKPLIIPSIIKWIKPIIKLRCSNTTSENSGIRVSACKSVFKVSSIEEIKKAIKTIEDGYVINIDDVKKYAEAIFSLCFKSTIYSKKEEFIIPDDLMLKNDYIKLADEFVKSYKMHYLNEK